MVKCLQQEDLKVSKTTLLKSRDILQL